MSEPTITLDDIGTLSALAEGIIPADDRDSGAAMVHAGPSIAERMRRSPSAHVYVEGLRAARALALERFGRDASKLDANAIRELLEAIRDQLPGFFRLIARPTCAAALSQRCRRVASHWLPRAVVGEWQLPETSINPSRQDPDEYHPRVAAVHSVVPPAPSPLRC